MDWEQLRERTLGEVGTSLVAEGAGVTVGFIGAAILGRQVQNRVKPDPSGAFASISEKVMAWGSNNLPKAAAWYLLKKYTDVEPGETLTPMKEATLDAKKAISGSIIYDTLVRLSNGGKNPGDVSLWGYQIMSGEQPQQKAAIQSQQADIQRLIQENSALRAELNKALQRLAAPPVPAPAPAPVQVAPQPAPVQVAPQPAPVVRAAPVAQPAPVVNVTPVQQAPPVVRYQPVAPPVPAYRPVSAQPVPPAVSERERKYGFMESNQTPPQVQERQQRFGFMKASEEKDVASMFGML